MFFPERELVTRAPHARKMRPGGARVSPWSALGAVGLCELAAGLPVYLAAWLAGLGWLDVSRSTWRGRGVDVSMAWA